MRINSLIVFFMVIFSGVSFADVCELKGYEVTKFAYQKGFKFESSSTGDASCTISSHKAGGSSASNGQGECVFDFFQNKKLRSPWVFKDASYAGKHFEIIKNPIPGASDLHMKVKLAPTELNTANFLISKIIMQGGACDKWESAF